MIVRAKLACCTCINKALRQRGFWPAAASAAHRLHDSAKRHPGAVVSLWALGAALGLVALALQDAALVDLCVRR